MDNRVCQNSLVRRKDYPPLWRSLDRSKKQCNGSYNLKTLEALEEEFSVQPELRGWSLICQNTLVVGQEFTLTSFFLCRHRLIYDAEQGLRKDGWDLQFFTLIMALFSLLLVAAFSDSQRSREKARIRFLDSILLGIFLRLMAAALKTLTASYSSDTVYALAIAGMVIHLFGCNYTYASYAVCVNDDETRRNHPLSRSPIARPPFLGGTTSLSAAFFSTTLLASRLEGVWTVHLFVTSSVTIFAFFPATRHGLFLKSPQHAPSVLLVSTSLLFLATLVDLKFQYERIAFILFLMFLCVISPSWMYFLQKSKVHLVGPWDIPHIHTLD